MGRKLLFVGEQQLKGGGKVRTRKSLCVASEFIDASRGRPGWKSGWDEVSREKLFITAEDKSAGQWHTPAFATYIK